ncbi:MAG: PIG-L family deacetylase [Phycisphaerae bacterium]|jgi:LmbE family N-acetylglucosaminyl deacetylase
MSDKVDAGGLALRGPVLVLAPHTDDGEFGCGGTISKLIAAGLDVYYMALSIAEDSLPAGWPKDTLKKEVTKATASLGIPNEHLIVYQYPVRRFLDHRQDILEKFVAFKRAVNPQLVFLPSIHDTHQDHAVVSQEGFRAFKTVCMLGYEIPWNNLQFDTSCFIRLEEAHIEAKIRAMQCYESQKGRAYASGEFLWSLARCRGIQIGGGYAETFSLFRWVM